MSVISCIKLVAETVTAIAAAIVVIIHLFSRIPTRVKASIKRTVLLFVCGIVTDRGEKVRFFKAIRANKEHQQSLKNIVQALMPEYETEEVLVLNKVELLKMLEESKLFIHIKR